jgi:hypothetical protein
VSGHAVCRRAVAKITTNGHDRICERARRRLPTRSVHWSCDAQLAGSVAQHVVDGQWPERVTFDFSRLTFIRPAGVVFLRNIIRWLCAKGCKVFFRGHHGESEPIKYLRDAQFFRLHLEGEYEEEGACRPTTRPLIDVKYERSQSWIRLTLIPWVAGQARVSTASLYGLQSSMAEIFNNISEHARHDIGSVFGQYFPNENVIIIAVSDMGLGIPANVKKLRSELSDPNAIIEAVKQGFTTKSVATNTQLLRSVVSELGGKVTIYSGAGIVTFEPKSGGIGHRGTGGVGLCPGTTIEIRLDPRCIPVQPANEEDIEW